VAQNKPDYIYIYSIYSLNSPVYFPPPCTYSQQLLVVNKTGTCRLLEVAEVRQFVLVFLYRITSLKWGADVNNKLTYFVAVDTSNIFNANCLHHCSSCAERTVCSRTKFENFNKLCNHKERS